MAPPPPPSSCSSSSCSSNSPRLPPRRSHHFTPIEEGDESEEESWERRRPGSASNTSHHHPSPLHITPSPSSTTTIGAVVAGKNSSKKRLSDKVAVSCTNCRPASRDKTTASSVVPVADGVNKQYSSSSSSYSLSMPSPNAILKSILSGVARRSPKPSSETSSTSSAAAAAKEERWKIAVAELSHKLVHASRKRDEAVLEASQLKYSMAELEKKLNKLEVYCHNLKSGLEVCNGGGGSSIVASPGVGAGGIINNERFSPFNHLRIDGHDQIIENFLISVSEARSAVRLLSRALTVQIRQMGVKVFERISSLFQPYDIKISLSKNPRNLIFYMEALLNMALFEDFESVGFMKNSTNRILNPLDRCEAQYAAFNVLKGLTWEEVLSKGTKHFSEDFSKFCDRKMSEIVGMLGWNRAWPEPLLQAFFGVSKSVWLVHLLANSVHPGLPIFRVEKGSRFDSVYMEDMGGDRTAHRLVPTVVRIMVAPGFYVYDNVVKCKVLCRYHSSSSISANGGTGNYPKGFSP